MSRSPAVPGKPKKSTTPSNSSNPKGPSDTQNQASTASSSPSTRSPSAGQLHEPGLLLLLQFITIQKWPLFFLLSIPCLLAAMTWYETASILAMLNSIGAWMYFRFGGKDWSDFYPKDTFAGTLNSLHAALWSLFSFACFFLSPTLSDIGISPAANLIFVPVLFSLWILGIKMVARVFCSQILMIRTNKPPKDSGIVSF